MINFTYAFQRVVAALDKIDSRYLVVGSTAAGAWGVARSTRDVDIVAVISKDSVEGFLNELVDGNLYVPVESARRASLNGGSFNILHTSSGGKVDVFICSPDDQFEKIRLDRRVRLEILGLETWVATPEDVILSKLKWRLKTRSDTQWRDCIEIAAAQKLDIAHMRSWSSHLGVSIDLEELLVEIVNSAE